MQTDKCHFVVGGIVLLDFYCGKRLKVLFSRQKKIIMLSTEFTALPVWQYSHKSCDIGKAQLLQSIKKESQLSFTKMQFLTPTHSNSTLPKVVDRALKI